jgi:hypothetical protein
LEQDTGKALRAGAYRPVNAPEAVRVEEDAAGLPLVVRMPRRQRITAVEDRWRIDDEWWRAGPVSRLYYNVLPASGQRLVLYKDLASGNWYQQDY